MHVANTIHPDSIPMPSDLRTRRKSRAEQHGNEERRRERVPSPLVSQHADAVDRLVQRNAIPPPHRTGTGPSIDAKQKTTAHDKREMSVPAAGGESRRGAAIREATTGREPGGDACDAMR